MSKMLASFRLLVGAVVAGGGGDAFLEEIQEDASHREATEAALVDAGRAAAAAGEAKVVALEEVKAAALAVALALLALMHKYLVK